MDRLTTDFRPNRIVIFTGVRPMNIISFPDHSSNKEIVLVNFPYGGNPQMARDFAIKNGLKQTDNNILDKEKGYMYLGIKNEFYVIETTGHLNSKVLYSSAMLFADSKNPENNEVKHLPEEKLGGCNDFFVFTRN